MTEREAIVRALSSLLSGNVERTRVELEEALARYDERNRMRREREALLNETMRRHGMTARQAKALLAVERPEFNWLQH